MRPGISRDLQVQRVGQSGSIRLAHTLFGTVPHGLTHAGLKSGPLLSTLYAMLRNGDPVVVELAKGLLEEVCASAAA